MSGIKQMLIKISNLTEGEHQFGFDEPVDNIELGEPFFGSIKTEVILYKLHNQIILKSHSVVNAAFECDRCSKPFQTELISEYEMVYMSDEFSEESDSINITYLSPDSVSINIQNDVREYSILSIPMKKLCREDCKGLCYRCGGDLNENQCVCTEPEIASRWQKLLDLKKNINNK